MPKYPERRGIAYQPAGHHGGFRSKNGDVVRPGKNTFVEVAIEDAFWGNTTYPCRLHRVFGQQGDKFGGWRLSTEIWLNPRSG